LSATHRQGDAHTTYCGKGHWRHQIRDLQGHQEWSTFGL